jgi:hypothetical protein
MSVKKVTFDGEGVSWTDKSIDYYIHRIDRSKMFDFVARRANVWRTLRPMLYRILLGYLRYYNELRKGALRSHVVRDWGRYT